MRLAAALPSPRFYVPLLVLLIFIAALLVLGANGAWWWLAAPAGLACLLALYDWQQKVHTIRRNYPLLGNFRWLFEAIRPEICQYLFESESEATPFSRAQRSLVYQGHRAGRLRLRLRVDQPLDAIDRDRQYRLPRRGRRPALHASIRHLAAEHFRR